VCLVIEIVLPKGRANKLANVFRLQISRTRGGHFVGKHKLDLMFVSQKDEQNWQPTAMVVHLEKKRFLIDCSMVL